MSLLINNIRFLVHIQKQAGRFIAGGDMDSMQILENAWLFIREGKIHSFGKAEEGPAESLDADFVAPEILDAKGGAVFPSWVDAHTHLVFAGSREQEFVDRIRGMSYQDIASRGGGILNSAAKLRSTSEDDLFESAWQRLMEVRSMGTAAIEIKSGYGLDLASELKMLRVIRRIKEKSDLSIKATFLGAHALPTEYKDDRPGYIRLLTKELMPAIQAEGLADYCDVFCEKNYFTAEETLVLLETAVKYGMRPKVHAEQLSHSGGIRAGIQAGAISVDHLEYANDEDITHLRNSRTMPVLLPGAQLFLGLKNPPAREMIQAGCPVALSSDFNPGSCPSGNMHQMVALACILYKMTPSEAIIAATTNSAYAMGVDEELGSICPGKTASLFITRPIPSADFLPYAFGSNLIDTIIVNGKIN